MYPNYGGYGADNPCACPPAPFPWWMIAVAAAVGIAGGYVVKEQMDKDKKDKTE